MTTTNDRDGLLRLAADQLMRDANELHARCAYGAGDEAADLATKIVRELKEGDYNGD